MGTAGKTRRKANYELLRIVAMFMVIVLHYLNYANEILRPGTPFAGSRVLGTVLESFCICAVNCYVLLSGYFLSRSGFRLRRIVVLVLEVMFYSLLIPAVLIVCGVPLYGRSLWDMFYYFLPISTNHYWFATGYVLMCLFSPLLNAAADALTRRQLKFTILGLLTFFCFIKSFCPIHLATDYYGYDFGWFLCLYLIAAYIQRYDCPRFDSPRRAAAMYAGSSALIAVLLVALYFMNSRTSALTYYASVPLHYNSLLCLVAALGLFLLFRYIHIPEGALADIIRRIAPLTFGVYLIHNSIDIRDKWLGWAEVFAGPVPEGTLAMLAHLLACVLMVYAACLIADWIRSMFFDYMIRVMRGTALADRIRRFDRIFSEEDRG